jgi:hypothetical protein
MTKCIRIWPRPNADRSSSHDAARTATIRRLARANEITNTQIGLWNQQVIDSPLHHFRKLFSLSLHLRRLRRPSDVRAAAQEATAIDNRDVAKHVRVVRFKSCFKPGSFLPSRSGSILASAEAFSIICVFTVAVCRVPYTLQTCASRKGRWGHSPNSGTSRSQVGLTPPSPGQRRAPKISTTNAITPMVMLGLFSRGGVDITATWRWVCPRLGHQWMATDYSTLSDQDASEDDILVCPILTERRIIQAVVTNFSNRSKSLVNT